ncbi:MAG: Rpn family recombination-promoting nuclease/putative transposase [Eubacterium sp.]|nr:Rpn family recombination-promoting nuclease/putative transposase [Eubacterium sp.]
MYDRQTRIPITNDFMFCRVMEDESICRAVLQEILPEIKIGRLRYLEKQKTLDAGAHSHGIRLDVFAQDDGRVYDIEMQCVNAGHLKKRSRYYQGQIDTALLGKGEDYERLRDSYVIFICTFDPFGYGQYIYHFENCCQEIEGLRLEDGARKVFINTKGTAGDIQSGLKALLNYFENRSFDETGLIKQIETAVDKANSDTAWRENMGTFEMRLRDYERLGRSLGRKEGRLEGRKEGREEGISTEKRQTARRLLEAGQTVDFIVQITGMAEKEILELQQNLNAED